MDRGRTYRPAKTETVRTLITEWSDHKAEQVYIFSELQEFNDGERELAKQEMGDEKWAKRIAKHYGIKFPKVKEDK